MSVLAAVTALNTILTEENAALAAMDLPAAAALLPRKQQAAEALGALEPGDVGTDAPVVEALRVLRVLAQTNKVLLEKALRIQQRLMKMIGDAARTNAPPTGYGARGTYAQASRTVAVALLARA